MARSMAIAANMYPQWHERWRRDVARYVSETRLARLTDFAGATSLSVHSSATRNQKTKLYGAQPPGSPLCADFAQNGVEVPSAATEGPFANGKDFRATIVQRERVNRGKIITPAQLWLEV